MTYPVTFIGSIINVDIETPLIAAPKSNNETVFQVRTVCLITFTLLFLFVRQSVVTVDGGKLVHVQKWDGKETTLVREVDGNSLTLVSIVCTYSKCLFSLEQSILLPI